MRVRSLVVTAVLACCAAPAAAQDPPPRPLPGTKICDQRFGGIRMEVRNPEGQPVLDAEVEVRDLAADSVIRRITRSFDGRGGYMVLDDALWQGVEPARFLVSARRGARTARAELLVGPDSTGCHIRRISGPELLVLR